VFLQLIIRGKEAWYKTPMWSIWNALLGGITYNSVSLPFLLAQIITIANRCIRRPEARARVPPH
jgi:hypothetical protein